MSNSLGSLLPLSNSSLYGANSSASAKAMDTSSGSGSTDTGSDNSLSVSNLGSTFLSLLAQELQNQDPTQPMSPTDEVGQMINLNQLDQLISINDVLTGTSTTASSTPQGGSSSKAIDATTGGGSGASSPAAQPNSLSSNAASDLNNLQQKLAESGLASSTQPLDLGTLMSLYGGK